MRYTLWLQFYRLKNWNLKVSLNSSLSNSKIPPPVTVLSFYSWFHQKSSHEDVDNIILFCFVLFFNFTLSSFNSTHITTPKFTQDKCYFWLLLSCIESKNDSPMILFQTSQGILVSSKNKVSYLLIFSVSMLQIERYPLGSYFTPHHPPSSRVSLDVLFAHILSPARDVLFCKVLPIFQVIFYKKYSQLFLWHRLAFSHRKSVSSLARSTHWGLINCPGKECFHSHIEHCYSTYTGGEKNKRKFPCIIST